MADLRFEWDPRKNAANLRKHGVDFEEGETVFADEYALLIDDPEHSLQEDRFVLLGFEFAPPDSGGGPYLPGPGRDHPAHLGPEGDQARARPVQREVVMRRQYDFSKARRNPYAKRLKRSVTIRLDTAALGYFEELATETGIPYQTLINLYLRDCAASGRKLAIDWKPRRKKRSLTRA